MSSLAKYVLFSGAAVGLAWAAVSVDVRGRTPYGHFLKAGGDAWVKSAQASWSGAWNQAGSRWDEFVDKGEPSPKRATKPKVAPKRRATPETTDPAPKVQESSGAKKRVALLKAAHDQVEPSASGSNKKRTQLDDPTNRQDRAALDRLVAGR